MTVVVTIGPAQSDEHLTGVNVSVMYMEKERMGMLQNQIHQKYHTDSSSCSTAHRLNNNNEIK